ncbi:uncharacterized protein G2W53_009113 [Senna tora]|uniref:Uncharacterized protein n=1 Tax=Senna tora TaxID=362788 RepID=A0A835C7J1_9FABA|nr:uncharacterized protein G2W53_009113 [Senna tora]
MNKKMMGNVEDGGDGDEAWKVLVVRDVLVSRRWGSRLCLFLKSVPKAMAIMTATVTTTMEATVTATESPSWWLKTKGQNSAVWAKCRGNVDKEI